MFLVYRKNTYLMTYSLYIIMYYLKQKLLKHAKGMKTIYLKEPSILYVGMQSNYNFLR